MQSRKTGIAIPAKVFSPTDLLAIFGLELAKAISYLKLKSEAIT